MTKRTAFRQSDVSRMLRAAQKTLPANSFQLRLVDGMPTILPFTGGQALTPAQDAEKRMQEAFGEL